MFQELALTDRELLEAIVCRSDEDPDALADAEAQAFPDMLNRLGNQRLSVRQREWALRVYRRLGLDADRNLNLVSSGVVPRGREVSTPAVLENRPLKPPARRR